MTHPTRGGAPVGNDNAVGSDGGCPPENNQNAAKHHLRSDPFKLLNWLETNEPEQHQWVLNKYQSYLDDAPFGPGSAKADKLLEVCVCEWIIWKNRGIQLRDGIVTKTHIKGSDGELVEVEDERPENQAINRMDRQVMQKLDKLGIFDENESESESGRYESEDYIIIESTVEEPEPEPESESEESDSGGEVHHEGDSGDDGEEPATDDASTE